MSEPDPAREAERALDHGDFAEARRLARTAIASEREESARALARQVLDRLRPDPIFAVIYLVALAFFVLAIVTTIHR